MDREILGSKEWMGKIVLDIPALRNDEVSQVTLSEVPWAFHGWRADETSC